MKKYLRICYFTEKADVVLAFLSSLLLIYISLCYTGKLTTCFYRPYVSSEYLAGGVLGVNYIMLVGANPIRIFLALVLMPVRMAIVLLSPLLFILSFAALAAAAQSGADATRALKRKDKAEAARHAREAAKFGAIGAASGYGASRSYGVIASRIRSLNKAFVPISSNDMALSRTPRRKSPLLAGWLSFLIPGSGQMYCGRFGRGLLFPMMLVVAVIVMAACDASGWVAFAIIVAIPVMACIDARRLARRYGK